jgi:alpha-tubulin suppressor-like RCC1 family protein
MRHRIIMSGRVYRYVQIAACLRICLLAEHHAPLILHLHECAGKRDLCVPKPTVPFLTVRMVACGGMHSVALTTSGEIWQWGEPWGDFSIDVNRSPRKLAAANVVSIASGAFHNLALNIENKVLSWGTNDFGQLGTGDTTYAREPRYVVDIDGVNVADIEAGGWHSLALSDKGEVYTWGRGEYGRLGLNEMKGTSHVRPCKVPGLQGHCVIQVRPSQATCTCLCSIHGREHSRTVFRTSRRHIVEYIEASCI